MIGNRQQHGVAHQDDPSATRRPVPWARVPLLIPVLLRVLGIAVLLATLITPPAAQGHRLKSAFTTVLFNERSGRLEVMHQFYLHDAEQVASEIIGPLTGQSANLFERAEDRQRFAIYVHERFSLFDPAGERLLLTLRGAEIDGDFLWVYQAMHLPDPPLEALAIEHRALRDLWPDQVNTVNVEGAGPIRTLTFRDAVSRLSVDLSRE